MKESFFRSEASLRHSSRRWRGIALSLLGLALIVTGVMVALPRLSSTHAANAGTDWPMYMHDLGHSGYNSAETIINQTSAPNLKQHWAYQVSTGTAIFSQPVVVNGLIYWGSFDGYEHATNLNGQQVWSQKLGGYVTQCAAVGGLGIVSSAAIVNGVVYVGGADHNLYALNAATGQILWHTLLGTNADSFLWDSPFVFNNTVYIGTATSGEGLGCKLIAGQFFALNASNGAIVHTFNSVPAGCVGGGIWSSPTFDTSDGSIYITTGTQGSCSADHISIGIVQLRASDLTYEGSWQIPLNQRLTQDADFGGTPTLFTATINGTLQKLVGAVDKNGYYYAFKRGSLSSGPVWSRNISIAGACPQCGKGSISSSAFDGARLYVAGGITTINGITCKGAVRALNPGNGKVLWATCVAGPVMGSVTGVPGVIAVVAGPALTLVNAQTGAELFSTRTVHFYGSPSISNGVLYVGSTSGQLVAFGT